MEAAYIQEACKAAALERVLGAASVILPPVSVELEPEYI